jgi:Protein of unknown function (DUF2637)
MNLPLPTTGQQGQVRNWPRRRANTAVAVAVLAVAAATFVLSYSGVRAIAITGGVSTQLARVYPGVFDAVLVIACVAAVLLRDARWWARAWAWLVVVVLLAAIGATDMLHAMGYTLRHRPTEGIVAAAPVAAVLLAFSLLLTLLRQTRTGTGPTAGRRAANREPGALPAIAAGASPRLPAPPIALPAASDAPRPEVATTREEPVLEAAAQPTVDSPVVLAAPDASDAPEAADAADAFDAADASDASQTADIPQALETHPPTDASELISPVTPETPEPAEDPRPAPPSIRYASSALNQRDYWDAEDDRQFAGQVYPDPSIEEHVPSFNRVRSTPTPPADDED